MDQTPYTHSPGSAEALSEGCLCPVLDNHYGRGSNWGLGKFWVNANCPLHGIGGRNPMQHGPSLDERHTCE